MHTSFNPDRFIALDFHGEDQQINVTEMQPLRDALDRREIQPNTPVLYTERGGKILVFQTRHFALYNVMQNSANQPEWMATFCSVCNAGMSFSPVIDGVRYDFYGAGFYDAMTLLADKQTGSYWDHVTGECIAGAMQGARLQQLSNLTHSRAHSVAKMYPDAMLIVSSLDAGRAQMEDMAEALRTLPQPEWLPMLHDTLDLDLEDKRLPRLEMGLGVWTPTAARFYPFKTIHTLDNILVDRFNGEGLLVYVDPETSIPAALFTDAASAAWQGEILMLDNGQYIQNSRLMAQGEALTPRRPLQLFQRWYGFSITFPGCQLYQPKPVTGMLPNHNF